MNKQSAQGSALQMKLASTIFSALIVSALAGPAPGDEPMPPAEALKDSFPAQKSYSPYAGRNFATQVYFGDTHVHTGASMDAGAFGARTGPDEAFRFARGEEITAANGMKVRLSRPLDFIVVADHSDNMGFFPKLLSGDPSFLADETGKRWYELIQKGGTDAVGVATEVIDKFSKDTFPPALASVPGSETFAPRGKKTFVRRKRTTSQAASVRSSATSGPRTLVATTCIAW